MPVRRWKYLQKLLAEEKCMLHMLAHGGGNSQHRMGVKELNLLVCKGG